MRSSTPSPRPRQAARAAVLLTLAAAGLAHAGQVDVSYVEPERYADAGRGIDAERVRDTLTQHLRALGEAWLPADQSLHIEVLDIDLAGELRPWITALPDVRVMTGRADWPRIELRYTLSAGERVITSGSERVSDSAYLEHPARGHDGVSLPYEAGMLTRWFRERFAPAAGTPPR